MIAGRLKAAMIVDWTHSWIGERNPKLWILWDQNAAHTRYSCWSLTHHCFWISADFGWEILIWMLLEVFCHLLSKNLDVIVINSFVLVMIILYAGTKKVHFDETYSDNWILTILRSLRRNYVDFLYKNLESLLCIIVACLFLVMTASRVQAESGPVCLSSYLHIEKNATSVTTHICLILQKKRTLVLFCLTLVMYYLTWSWTEIAETTYCIHVLKSVFQISAILLFSTLLLLMKPSRLLGRFSMIMFVSLIHLFFCCSCW